MRAYGFVEDMGMPSEKTVMQRLVLGRPIMGDWLVAGSRWVVGAMSGCCGVGGSLGSRRALSLGAVRKVIRNGEGEGRWCGEQGGVPRSGTVICQFESGREGVV